LHLLYARFWHKVLFDHECVSTAEPFQRLVNQGMILGDVELTGYRDPSGAWVSLSDVKDRKHRRTGEDLTPVKLEPEQVEKRGESTVLADDPKIVVESRAYKMSKARGNVVNPDDIVKDYGADSLRLYEMFMGPLEATKPWSMSGVEGVARFLGRVWRMVADDRAEDVQLDPAVQDVEPTEEQLRVLHKTIKAVTDDTQRLSFNTAISRMMEFVNEIGQLDPRPKSLLDPFVLILSPYAPHLAEELWEVLGHSDTLAYEPWPEYDESLLVETTMELPVQVNGKVRGRITVSADADSKTIEQTARDDETVARNLDGKAVAKVIVVPGRLVNFVVK
jgi:leucyl-tRNA synthetase